MSMQAESTAGFVRNVIPITYCFILLCLTHVVVSYYFVSILHDFPYLLFNSNVKSSIILNIDFSNAFFNSFSVCFYVNSRKSRSILRINDFSRFTIIL